MQFESLEGRRLFAGEPGVLADLLADANRDGVIDAADDAAEDRWTPGRGAIVLPNLDRDNTTTGAPDNWSGGAFNGRPAAPNNVIDNAADLADVGVVRLAKLKTLEAYNYTLTIRVLRPASDPSWFRNAAATDRVRLFLPGKADASGNTVLQPGDAAGIGRGIGDTIVFKAEPVAPNEYNINDVAGDGAYHLGVEGITPGAVVRVEATLEWTPAIADGEPLPPERINRDVVELKVAPFTLLDNRQRVKQVIVEDLNRLPAGFDNADLRDTLKDVFGGKVIESRNGDLWQQDGYEIGYVKAPYGQMNVVLELPRARLAMSGPDASMRQFVRGTLLRPGVGVSLDVANFPIGDNSSLGGDIETLSKPGSAPGTPGYLLMSYMPGYLRDFFYAQGVNKPLDLPLGWLAVNHVDEVVQQTPTGKVLVADPDVAWALLLWANKLDPNARMQPGMNGNEAVSGYTPEGLKVSQVLKDERLRWQNLDYAQRPGRLGTVREKVRAALGLKDDVTSPAKGAANKGTVSLSRGGAFVHLLGNVERAFELRFTGSDAYQLRYRDAGGAWSKWYAGRKSADAVFPEAKAFVLKNYWSGSARKGDTFTFKTVPDATLLRMPQLFASPFLLADPSNPTDPFLAPFTVNHINALVDGTTVVTGKAFGPKVAWRDSVRRDLLQDYVSATFRRAGYRTIEFADSTTYHNTGGNIHCGTNAIREIPRGPWWA
jgi:protein-arginine deiminase